MAVFIKALPMPSQVRAPSTARGPSRSPSPAEPATTFHRRIVPINLPFSALAEDGKLIGTIRLWNVVAGSAGDGLLLGPLAVDGARTCEGIGSALMNTAIEAARAAGHRAIILVGDHP